MAALSDIVEFLDRELRIAEIPDYPTAHNGLQLENRSGEVNVVAAAVDATLPVVEKAIAVDADLLVVHHGMFWSGVQLLQGSVFDRIASAIETGLAIYSAHIPLDVHPRWGNNALLCEALGLVDVEPFHDWNGIQLGLRAPFSGSRDDLAKALGEATGAGPHLCPGGGEEAGVVGVVTGGAGSEVAAMAAAGIDSFVTGEGPHWSYTAAEELGVNLLYGGHYATETFGVRRLADVIAGEFGTAAEFIDHPTGL